MYSANNTTPELLFINILKQLSYDKIHVVYINDVMRNNEIILSETYDALEESDCEDEKQYDMNLIKTYYKSYLNLFNIESPTFTQNMISWLIF
jgi:hypothetical protein